MYYETSSSIVTLKNLIVSWHWFCNSNFQELWCTNSLKETNALWLAIKEEDEFQSDVGTIIENLTPFK